MNLVVDASVALKWVLPEEGSDEAEAFGVAIRGGKWPVACPDLLFSEAANALWKRVSLKNELSLHDARVCLETILRLPFAVYPSRDLLAQAMDTAVRYGISVYDAQYVALSHLLSARLVTADDHLITKLKAAPSAIRPVLLSKWESLV